MQFDIKFEGFGHLDHLQKNFSELRMILNKFLLELPPINIDSELFSLGLTRELFTREMIKFCIHYIIARLYDKYLDVKVQCQYIAT